MHRAFHNERRNVVANLCPCHVCTHADNLKLKFVAHIGEVASQRIRDRRKLVGIDVIQVHRMLKNEVAAPEYVLWSEELYRTAEDALPEVRAVSQELEGIGRAGAYFFEIGDGAGALPPPPDPPGRRASGGRSTWPAAASRT